MSSSISTVLSTAVAMVVVSIASALSDARAYKSSEPVFQRDPRRSGAEEGRNNEQRREERQGAEQAGYTNDMNDARQGKEGQTVAQSDTPFPGYTFAFEGISSLVRIDRSQNMPLQSETQYRYTAFDAPRILVVPGNLHHMNNPLSKGGGFVEYVRNLFGQKLVESAHIGPTQVKKDHGTGWCIHTITLSDGSYRHLVVVASLPPAQNTSDALKKIKYQRICDDVRDGLRALPVSWEVEAWTPLIGTGWYKGPSEDDDECIRMSQEAIVCAASHANRRIAICDSNAAAGHAQQQAATQPNVSPHSSSAVGSTQAGVSAPQAFGSVQSVPAPGPGSGSTSGATNAFARPKGAAATTPSPVQPSNSSSGTDQPNLNPGTQSVKLGHFGHAFGSTDRGVSGVESSKRTSSSSNPVRIAATATADPSGQSGHHPGHHADSIPTVIPEPPGGTPDLQKCTRWEECVLKYEGCMFKGEQALKTGSDPSDLLVYSNDREQDKNTEFCQSKNIGDWSNLFNSPHSSALMVMDLVVSAHPEVKPALKCEQVADDKYKFTNSTRDEVNLDLSFVPSKKKRGRIVTAIQAVEAMLVRRTDRAVDLSVRPPDVPAVGPSSTAANAQAMARADVMRPAWEGGNAPWVSPEYKDWCSKSKKEIRLVRQTLTAFLNMTPFKKPKTSHIPPDLDHPPPPLPRYDNNKVVQDLIDISKSLDGHFVVIFNKIFSEKLCLRASQLPRDDVATEVITNMAEVVTGYKDRIEQTRSQKDSDDFVNTFLSVIQTNKAGTVLCVPESLIQMGEPVDDSERSRALVQNTFLNQNGFTEDGVDLTEDEGDELLMKVADETQSLLRLYGSFLLAERPGSACTFALEFAEKITPDRVSFGALTSFLESVDGVLKTTADKAMFDKLIEMLRTRWAENSDSFKEIDGSVRRMEKFITSTGSGNKVSRVTSS